MTVDPAPDDADPGGDDLFVPAVTGAALPDPRVMPTGPVTRFAPAPISTTRP